MKKILFISIILNVGLLAGCAGGTANTANAPTRPSTPAATPTTATTANSSSNSRTGNISPTSSNVRMSNSRIEYDKMSNSSRIEYNKNRESNTRTTNSDTTSTPPPAEKKDEGLFSFPPPRPTSVVEIPKAELPSSDGSRTIAETSDKIVAGLKAVGYQNGKYTFFWNDSNEFAVVTAMERIQPSGEFSLVGRWDDSDMLPRASGGEYFNDLIAGRKVYYRVFAFIFTPKNKKWQTYLRGTPPDFNTARHWIENPSGGDTVGEGDSSDIAAARFTDDYKCFELLYLFVNHTSLDAPTAIDLRDDKDEKRVKAIITELNTDAAEHRRKTNIRFGEER